MGVLRTRKTVPAGVRVEKGRPRLGNEGAGGWGAEAVSPKGTERCDCGGVAPEGVRSTTGGAGLLPEKHPTAMPEPPRKHTSSRAPIDLETPSQNTIISTLSINSTLAALVVPRSSSSESLLPTPRKSIGGERLPMRGCLRSRYLAACG